MNISPPPLPPLPSEHRLVRLTRWVSLRLAWFAAFALSLLTPRAAKRMAAAYARWAQTLIVVRALRRVRPPPLRARRPYNPLRVRPASMRCVAGARLNRALRGASPIERARAIHAVLADAETWIACVVQRLRRGFSKLRALPRPRCTAAPLVAAPCAPCLGADTS